LKAKFHFQISDHNFQWNSEQLDEIEVISVFTEFLEAKGWKGWKENTRMRYMQEAKTFLDVS
jgi:hypothetical protein